MRAARIRQSRWKSADFQPAALLYINCMPDSKTTFERNYPEMRWRCLSLAADLDRVARGDGGVAEISGDARWTKLQKALAVLMDDEPDRAMRVQMIFSDLSARD